MKNVLLQWAIKLNNERKRRKGWQKLVQTLSVIVVFCTTYALILPAITMEKDAICGFDAHTHIDSCYELQTVSALQCGDMEADAIVHQHDSLCYDANGALLCKLEEKEEHAHTDACYTAGEAVLICTEAEAVGHTHGDACYETVEVPCALIGTEGHECTEACVVTERKLICTEAESAGHAHVDGCYQAGEPILTCDKEELALHEHTEECYIISEDPDVAPELICTEAVVIEHVHAEACLTSEEVKVQICELQEHEHNDDCYPEVLYAAEPTPEFICNMGEHTHDADCYDEANVLICTMSEHTHTDVCRATKPTPDVTVTPAVTVYICGKEVHAHEAVCYDAAGAVTCGLEEHTHEDACVAAETPTTPAEPTYICGKEVHAHEAVCYDAAGAVTCGLEEHTHEDACVAAETPTTPAEPTYICGKEAHTHEETACYDAEGAVICGLEEHTHEDACVAADTSTTPAEPTYICGKEVHTHEAACYDAEGAVICGKEEHTHEAACEQAAPAEPVVIELPLICTIEEHTHEDACYQLPCALIGTEGHECTDACIVTGTELACGKEEHTHSLKECYEPAKADYTYEDDYVSMTVHVVNWAPLPDGLTMQVTALEADNETYTSYEDYAVENSDGELLGLNGYSIGFTDGKSILPLLDAEITVDLDVKPVEYTPPATFGLLRSTQPAEDTPESTGVTVSVLQNGEDGVNNEGEVLFENGVSTQTGVTFTLSSGRTFALANRSVVNPEFTVQYYAHFPKMQYSTDKSELDYYLDIIDTRGNGDGEGGDLPENGKGKESSPTGNPLLYLELERTGETTNQMSSAFIAANASDGAEAYVYKVRTELTLEEVYFPDEYTYSSGMNIMNVDKLHENGHYELSEVWISHDNEATWTVYTEDRDHWTLAANGNYIHQEQNDEGQDYSVFEAAVTELIEMTELHDVTFTNNAGGIGSVYVTDQSIVRMVYDLKTGTQNVSANFFDYDISDTQAYLYDTDSEKYYEYDSVANAIDDIDSREYNGNIYMMTSNYGINSVDAYLNTGDSFDDDASYLAFGNQNTGVIHRYDTLNGYYINGGNNNTFRTCSFGLVKGLIDGTSFLDYADGIIHQALFNDEQYYGEAVAGKTSYSRQRLNFNRTGDTYILTAVNGGSANGDLGNGITENQLDTFIHPGYAWNIDPTVQIRQFANNFWPLDGTTGDDVGTHDMEFGYYNEENNRRFVGTTLNGYSGESSFPNSDDGNAHNSYFGMEFAVDFQLDGEYCGPLEYLFYGDDDMWVFLTNEDTGEVQQICDIGGVHGSVGSFTDLWDYIPKGEESAGYYRLNFYYTERGATGSSCYMAFTLPAATSVPQNIPETGSVSVEKDIPNADISADETFAFKFELSGASSGINDEFAYEILNADGTTASEDSIKTGETFELKEGQRITIVGIPKGLTYTITEQLTSDRTDGYAVSWTGQREVDGASVTGTIQNGVTHSYTCTNTAVGELSISKTINGSYKGDEQFTFDVTLADKDGNPVDGIYGGVTFTEGTGLVQVAVDQTVKLTAIPIGYAWTVTEQQPNDKYTVEYKVDGTVVEAPSGTITHDTTIEVAVVNTVWYNLPNTGGPGTHLFTFGGMLLIASAGVYTCILWHKRRKGGG